MSFFCLFSSFLSFLTCIRFLWIFVVSELIETSNPRQSRAAWYSQTKNPNKISKKGFSETHREKRVQWSGGTRRTAMGGKRKKSESENGGGEDDEPVTKEKETKTRTKTKTKKEILPSMIKNKDKRSEVHAKLKHDKKLEKRKRAKARDAAIKRALELGEEVPPVAIVLFLFLSSFCLISVFNDDFDFDFFFFLVRICSLRLRRSLGRSRTQGSLMRLYACPTMRRFCPLP